MHPDRIGPYLIDRKIGSGGMGNVYLGVHDETQQQVAVKVLPASMAREEGFVLRFSREIQALRKLSNDHIVKIYEDGKVEDGGYFYSMEFVDGETLTSLVQRRKRLPWQEVVEITLQIATALKAAHNAGIVHRDLKPSNLMVRKDGEIKLTDFGVAHVFATTRLTRTGGVVGTAEYMSPEQARGKQATKRSDLYSLGAVMYVMLTGRPPFTGNMASDILHKHQFSQFDKPSRYVPELPRMLEDFVCTLLEKKPDERFPDALVLIRKLQNVRSLIEFKEAEQTPTGAESDLASTSDHTALLASDRTRDGGNREDVQLDGRGPATMIRDVMRHEIDQRMQKSPLAKFFDNTYVLITLFALVIAAGYYLSKTTVPDPDDLFVQAERVMNAKPGSSWIRTRNDILEPLLEDDALPEKRQQMETWVQQANQFEFCRGLKVSTSSEATEQSEIQRLVRRSFDLYASGDTVGAVLQLKAVKAVIRRQPKYEYLEEFVSKRLTDWEGTSSEEVRRSLVSSLVDKARATAESNPMRAVELLSSTLLLYRNDLATGKELQEAESLLKAIKTAAQDESQAEAAQK